MNYELHPVEFEIYENSLNDVAVKITQQDESCATIDIKTGVNRKSFDLLAPLIQQALSAMNLKGDK